jgi:hypothetical protein
MADNEKRSYHQQLWLLGNNRFQSSRLPHKCQGTGDVQRVGEANCVISRIFIFSLP